MRYALLTGVGRPGQVGEAVAARMAADGYSLLLVDRNPDAVEERASEIRAKGGQAVGFSADLASEVAVRDLAGRIAGVCGGSLAAFVHMAGGFAVTGAVADTSLEDWEKQLTINLRTAFLTSRAVIPMLRPQKGAAVYFSSESALNGAKVARVGAYAVAKAGLLTLVSAIAQEEGTNGVRANVLAPSAIRTATNSLEMPNGRFVERESVAAVVSWLCSEEAQPVTGQVVRLTP
jgi:NAD(P)-dependent dehydrogenase (short-subunit alcohol dehydrogenase family)